MCISRSGFLEENFYSLYGGIFFVGIFLGFLFLIATVLIIYYKQVSRAMRIARPFVIMQKVGMDKREVRRTINKVKNVLSSAGAGRRGSYDLRLSDDE